MIRKFIPVIFLSAIAASANANPIVAPNALATTMGNIDNCIPLTGCNDKDRYQQVYNASEFSSLSGPAFITQIAFRRAFDTAFSNSFSNLSFGLSTTAAAADALSTSFSANRGADYTEVVSGAITIESTSTGGASTLTPFDVVINFTTGFLYNPNSGNLLLEIQNFGSEDVGYGQLDAHNASDSISRLVGTTATGDTADWGDSFGLVTQFTFAEVPEPSSLLLLALGMLGLRTRRVSFKAG